MYLNNVTTERQADSTETGIVAAHCKWIESAAYQSGAFPHEHPCRMDRHTAHIRRKAASFPQRRRFQQIDRPDSLAVNCADELGN
jgi:hypothetical protein